MNRSGITVLGSTGFIGSHLVQYPQRHGYGCNLPEKGDESIYTGALGHVIYAIGLMADFRSRPLDTVEAHVCLLQRLIRAGNFESLTYLSSTRAYVGAADTAETIRLSIFAGLFRYRP